MLSVKDGCIEYLIQQREFLLVFAIVAVFLYIEKKSDDGSFYYSMFGLFYTIVADVIFFVHFSNEDIMLIGAVIVSTPMTRFMARTIVGIFHFYNLHKRKD